MSSITYSNLCLRSRYGLSIIPQRVWLIFTTFIANLKKTMCHSRFASGRLCQSKITEMAIITSEYIHAADTVRKHIMLSIRKRDLSVLNVQKIIYIDCSHCTIKRNCKKITPWQAPMFFCLFFVPRLFEEKRRDIVFGFPSFRLSFRPSVLPSVLPSPYRSMYLVCATPPTVLFRFF